MVLSIVLLLKYVARKRNMKKLNELLMKTHIVTGNLFAVALVWHTLVSLPLLKDIGIYAVFFGWLGAIAGIALIFSGFLINKKKNAMSWHRVSALILFVSIVLHSFH